MIVIFLQSCNEDNLSIKSTEFDLFGKWVVTEYIHTNGPICYDILENDTVSFERIDDKIDQMIFSYQLFDNQYHDTFSFNHLSGKILAEGNYNYADSSFSYPDSNNYLKQQIELLILDYKKIDFNLKIQNYDYKSGQLVFGDVSHFVARKISE